MIEGCEYGLADSAGQQTLRVLAGISLISKRIGSEIDRQRLQHKVTRYDLSCFRNRQQDSETLRERHELPNSRVAHTNDPGNFFKTYRL